MLPADWSVSTETNANVLHSHNTTDDSTWKSDQTVIFSSAKIRNISIRMDPTSIIERLHSDVQWLTCTLTPQ